MATRAWLCKLRVIDFMCRGNPAANLEDRERDAIFLCAIQMLEYDDVILTTESLRGFLWYTQLQVPLSGYIFLASELRQRTVGELCERAWKAICNNLARTRGTATGPGHGLACVATCGLTAGNGMPSGPEGMYQTSETNLDDNMMFPSLDSTSQMYGAAWPDYDQIDWTYLMQSEALVAHTKSNPAKLP